MNFQPADCVCLGLRRATRTVTRYYDDALRPLKLKATQFSLLAMLFKRGRTRFSELSEALATDQTTLTRNLQRLEGRGLIRITPGTDRRTRNVQLTAAGRSLYRRAEVLWQKAQVRATSVLGGEKWRRMQGQLDRLIGDLSE